MRIKYWFFGDAKWFEFWRPQSGLIGGLILSAIIVFILLIIKF